MALGVSILVLVSRRFIAHTFIDLLKGQLGDHGHLLVSMTSNFNPSIIADGANVSNVSDNANLVATV